MASCHIRSQMLSVKRALGNGCMFWRHISYDYHHRLSTRWNSSPLTTKYSHLHKTQFNYLQSSASLLSEDKQNVINQQTHDVNVDKDSDKSESRIPESSSQSDGDKTESVPEEKLTVVQRFKKTYREHGKVLVCVHLATSAVWFGSFFYGVKLGVDVIPVMEWLGFSEKIVSPFRNSSLGDVALAYLMYKLATPVRYTVTLAGTNFAIKYLRKVGKMQPKTPSSSLRSLAEDSRAELRKKRREVRNQTDKFETDLKREVRKTTNRVRTNIKSRQLKVKDRFAKFRSKVKEDRRRKSLESKKGKKTSRPK